MRLIPTKKDIAFLEYLDEASATVAKDALHNYKLDGENKIKVTFPPPVNDSFLQVVPRSHMPGSSPVSHCIFWLLSVMSFCLL